MQGLISNPHMLHNVCLVAPLLISRSKSACGIALILANGSISVLLCGSPSSPCDRACTEQNIAVTNIHMDLPALQCVSNVREMPHWIKQRICYSDILTMTETFCSGRYSCAITEKWGRLGMASVYHNLIFLAKYHPTFTGSKQTFSSQHQVGRLSSLSRVKGYY